MSATPCLLFSASLPLHCRVSSKCLFSLERSLLEADTVELEPFLEKCVQLGKMIHPQKQRFAFLCNHNKIKVPCQFPLSWMIVLCVGLLGCTNTFVQPIIHCPAFGSVLQLRYEVFEKSATAYTCSSTGRDFTRYAKSLCQHICGHWALKLQNIFTKYKILIKMQQYVYVMVLRKISVCKQSHWAGLPFSSFPVCST